MNFSYWECIHHQKTVQPFQNRLFFKVWSHFGQLSYKSYFQKRHPLTIGFKKQFKKNENVFVTRLFLVASSLLQTCVVSIRHIMMDSKDCYFSVLRFLITVVIEKVFSGFVSYQGTQKMYIGVLDIVMFVFVQQMFDLERFHLPKILEQRPMSHRLCGTDDVETNTFREDSL